jgi:DNA-binding CsgD family transcriptional regulator
LTPREQEVLSLLREGLSNREIAQRLGISIAGAKYHVSEIISKLGVTGRDEAAAWPVERRGWVRGFVFLQFANSPLGLIPPKFALAGAASLLLIIGLATRTLSGSINPFIQLLAGHEQAVVAATATPHPDCQPPSCFFVQRQKMASIAEVATLASFKPALPAYIPAGFTPVGIHYMDARGISSPRALHADYFVAYYKNEAGVILNVSQGYPAQAIRDWPGLTPDDAKGTTLVNGVVAQWTRGSPDAPYEKLDGPVLPGRPSTWSSSDALSLYWDIGSGIAWEISPAGELRTGLGAMSYGVVSTGLPIDELVRIAESVSFD